MLWALLYGRVMEWSGCAQAQSFLGVTLVLLLGHTLARPYKKANANVEEKANLKLDRLTIAAVFGLNLVALINVVRLTRALRRACLALSASAIADMYERIHGDLHVRVTCARRILQ